MSRALLEHEARLALSDYGIMNVPGAFCESLQEALDAAARIGYPVVLKIVSPQVVHKSEAGGVRVNIRHAAALEEAYEGMRQSVMEKVPGARIHGVLVTGFIEGAREVIVGAVRDSQFGPVVMAGLGGIFVEIFKDVSFGIAPVDRREAEQMLRSLKAYPVLCGARGQAAAGLEPLVELIVNVSRFAHEKDVLELDLNPVFLIDGAALAGDARVLLDDE